MTTMGCDVVTAALEYDEFEGATFYSAPPPPPPPPSLKELVSSLVDARDRARAALFIAGDWTDELSFSHYYHQHWANQMLHLTSLGALYFALLWAAAERHPVLPAAITVVISTAYTAIDVWLGGAFFVGLGVLAASSVALVSIIGADGHATARAVWTVVWAFSQLAGHALFEGRLPAFRPAEALVVTPALMVLLVLFRTGWAGDWNGQIRRRTMRWAGTEKFVWAAKTGGITETKVATE